MRITDLTAVYPNYNHVPPSWRTHLWQIVVRVEAATDSGAGVVGYGFGGGGKAAVEVVNGHMRELLVGRTLNDTADIAAAWDALYCESIPYGRKGIGVMALSGIDLALWDLLGKAENAPVHALIGPRAKDRIRSYATGADAEWYAELGFSAHKFPHRAAGGEADFETAERAASRARAIMGADAQLMIDTYMSWDAETTTRMAQVLAPYNIYWFEDVLTPDDPGRTGGAASRRQADSDSGRRA